MSRFAKRYFNDLVVGEILESATHEVTLDELLTFARQYDPQYFHTDPQAASESIFGEVIASGIYSIALWRRLDHQVSGSIGWICGIAWEEVRWPQPIRAGDIVRARAECLSKRPSQSDQTRGVVEYRYTLLNQRGEIAFTCRSINLVEMQPRVQRC
jgi:acyl dehydratase